MAMATPRQELDMKEQNAFIEQVRGLPRWMDQTRDWEGNSGRTAFWIAVNTAMTVLIVFMNKHTFQNPQLRQAQVSVAIWHFIATFLVLLTATGRRWRLFTPVRLPIAQVVPLSGFFAGFLVLNNLSLASNPVGFYQLAKILTTPCVVLLNFCLFRQTITRAKLLAVIVTCIGMSLVTVDSIQSSLYGAAVACMAFTATAAYQIWIGKKMADLHVDPPQLLLNQSATAVVLLTPVAMLIDRVPDFTAIPRQTLVVVLAGGLAASMINLSQFFIIGRTSALTFNIASHVKMMLILALGWYAERKHFTVVEIVGIMLAITGTWRYTFVRKQSGNGLGQANGDSSRRGIQEKSTE